MPFHPGGSGSERAKCEAMAQSTGLRNVEFRAPIPKGSVPALLGQADVLIASVKDVPVYRYGINFNKIFDYLAAGRPILFACNAPNDPVRESGSGISVQPEDPAQMAKAVQRFFSMKPEDRSRLGANGRAYAHERLDVKVLAEKFELLISDAVEGSTRRRGW